MHSPTLLDTLQACLPCLSACFRAARGRSLKEESLSRLAARLLEFQSAGHATPLPPPHFAAECTPSCEPIWQHWQPVLDRWSTAPDRLAEPILHTLIACWESTSTPDLLLLLGQRRTPASVTDERAIPPTQAELLQAASRLHCESDALTVAGRALTKHVVRSTGDFWGAVRGSPALKNEQALNLVQRILTESTWWNVFGHYKHVLVYEARLPTGHGARWACPNLDFIGFLEPFDEEQCPSLQSDPAEQHPAATQ
jgi:hypothetical protein